MWGRARSLRGAGRETRRPHAPAQAVCGGATNLFSQGVVQLLSLLDNRLAQRYLQPEGHGSSSKVSLRASQLPVPTTASGCALTACTKAALTVGFSIAFGSTLRWVGRWELHARSGHAPYSPGAAPPGSHLITPAFFRAPRNTDVRTTWTTACPTSPMIEETRLSSLRWEGCSAQVVLPIALPANQLACLACRKTGSTQGCTSWHCTP